MDGWTGVDLLYQTAPYFVIGLLIVGGCYGLSYLLLPRRVKRLYRQQKVRSQRVRYSWDASGVSFVTPNGEGHFDWAEIYRVRAGRSALLIYINDQTYLYLPWRALGEREAADVRACAGLGSRLVGGTWRA